MTGAPSIRIRIPAEYQKVLELVRDPVQKVIILGGSAGTGKTLAVRWLLQQLEGTAALIAPTAQAAFRIGGQSIHSFFRLPTGILDVAHVESLPTADPALLRGIRQLIIDECSMLRADVLDAIEVILRRHGWRPGTPFGGVNLVLAGDLLQFGPILLGSGNAAELRSRYRTGHFFSAQCLERRRPILIDLNENRRQSDAEFARRLEQLRRGENLYEAVQWVNRHASGKPAPVLAVAIVGSGQAAEEYNNLRLSTLPGDMVTYTAKSEGDCGADQRALPAPIELRLRVGTQVMFRQRSPDGRWDVGTLGIVDVLHRTHAVVRLAGGDTVAVPPVAWNTHAFQWSETTGRIERVITGRYHQIPLVPAYAISVEAAMGETYDAAIIDLDSGGGPVFGGITYAALSRCRSINGLGLRRPLRLDDFKADQYAKAFLDWISAAQSTPRAPVSLHGPRDTSNLNEEPSGHLRKNPLRSSPHVAFVSFASIDLDRCKECCTILEQAQVPCWYSPRDIRAHPDGFPAEIAKAISECRILVVIFSEQSKHNWWVKTELFFAHKQRKPILPIWLPRTDRSLPAGIDLLIAAFQHVDLGEATWDHVVQQVKAMLDARQQDSGIA